MTNVWFNANANVNLNHNLLETYGTSEQARENANINDYTSNETHNKL